MKIRTDFVTNSSSSSFICDVCGHDESGYDIDLSDARMFECEEEHTFCKRHISSDDMKKAEVEYVKSWIGNEIEENKANIDKIKLFKKITADKYMYDKDDIYEYLGDFEYHFPSKYCPICNLSTILSVDIAKYIFNKFGVTADDIMAEIKGKFGSLQEMHEAIKKA